MCEKDFMPVRNRHFRCMEATNPSERHVLFNFKSDRGIGQTHRFSPDILCGMSFVVIRPA